MLSSWAHNFDNVSLQKFQSKASASSSELTYPTLTHVPPERPFSMSSVLAPYQPDARLAAPEPPEPPPTTMKSYCFDTGAITTALVFNCLEISISRIDATLLYKRLREGLERDVII